MTGGGFRLATIVLFDMTRSAGGPFGTNAGLNMTVRFTPVPEPGSLALCGLGLLGGLVTYRQRRASRRG